MKFAFEDKTHLNNFKMCGDKNNSGLLRFTPCPMTSTLVRYWQTKDRYLNLSFANYSIYHHGVDPDTTIKYLISTGVNHSPGEWCGPDRMGQGYNPSHPDRKSVFALLNDKYLKDLQDNNAMLMLDQSHEGYQVPWLWSWFHNECDDNNISPRNIIYVTGNCLAEEQYTAWANTHGIVTRIKVVPYTHFENMINVTAENRVRIDGGDPLPTFESHIEHKTNNPEELKTFNALQKRIRPHRVWLYKMLHDHNLLQDGLCSMNEFTQYNTYLEGKSLPEDVIDKYNEGLPLKVYNKANNEKDDGYYITRFNDETILNTFVSVVSEASFADIDQTCFLSEKTFKSIAEYSPFIVYGNRRSLEFLKDFGYKTFHPHIDETYDTLPTFERLEAIIKEITRIKNIEDKVEWFKDMEDILQHNREVLRKNSNDYVPKAMIDVHRYYEETLNVR